MAGDGKRWRSVRRLRGLRGRERLERNGCQHCNVTNNSAGSGRTQASSSSSQPTQPSLIGWAQIHSPIWYAIIWVCVCSALNALPCVATHDVFMMLTRHTLSFCYAVLHNLLLLFIHCERIDYNINMYARNVKCKDICILVEWWASREESERRNERMNAAAIYDVIF